MTVIPPVSPSEMVSSLPSLMPVSTITRRVALVLSTSAITAVCDATYSNGKTEAGNLQQTKEREIHHATFIQIQCNSKLHMMFTHGTCHKLLTEIQLLLRKSVVAFRENLCENLQIVCGQPAESSFGSLQNYFFFLAICRIVFRALAKLSLGVLRTIFRSL